MKQRQDPTVDLVVKYLKQLWCPDLQDVQGIVRGMLTFIPDKRPHTVSDRLTALYPDSAHEVECWLQTEGWSWSTQEQLLVGEPIGEDVLIALWLRHLVLIFYDYGRQLWLLADSSVKSQLAAAENKIADLRHFQIL